MSTEEQIRRASRPWGSRRAEHRRGRIHEALAGSDTKRLYVRQLFGRIARRYDVTNDVMSLGLHRRWKKQLLRLADIRPGHVVLDLASGTGDLALRVGEGSRVLAADLTMEMLKVGRSKQKSRQVEWTQCDALALPLPDRSVDRVLIGYGLRNFADLDAGLREIQRCLKPGGRLVALDFGRVSPPRLHRLYLRYLDISTAVVGWLLHRDAESYLYIPESLRQFPAQTGVADRMLRLGFERCGYLDLWFGVMAINFGDVPV
ncbi:MAG: ubiquinone/menaquinone biosynthesis methyltransferase [Gemmatimonadota bacterium]